MYRGLKLHVTALFFALLVAATGLTFFVIGSFWLRDSALSLAREKGVEMAAVAERLAGRRMELGKERGFFAALVNEGVSRAGAMSGCGQAEHGVVLCLGQPLPDRQHLERQLREAMQTGKAVRSLNGLAWVGVVPGKKYLDIALPAISPDHVRGGVALRFSLEPHYARIRTMQRLVAGYLAVNLIVLLVIGFFRLRSAVFRPVEQLIRLTDSYRDESGVPFLALQGGDELRQLAGSMQQMLARIKADQDKLREHVASLQEANRQLIASREEMVRAEKLSSVGRLAAGLAHEIGNPLGIVQGYLGLIRHDDLGGAEREEFCSRAEHELQRIGQLVRQLLDFSRPASGHQEAIDPHQVLAEVIALLQPQPLMDSITLTTRFAAMDCLVHANPAQLMQVLLNCLINAADAIRAATSGQGTIEVATDVDLIEPARMLRITISDTGVGLTKDELANAFDPFFTTKEPGRGTGLGLSVSYALLKSMGGVISLANREGGGAVVTIALPLAASQMLDHAESGV